MYLSPIFSTCLIFLKMLKAVPKPYSTPAKEAQVIISFDSLSYSSRIYIPLSDMSRTRQCQSRRVNLLTDNHGSIFKSCNTSEATGLNHPLIVN